MLARYTAWLVPSLMLLGTMTAAAQQDADEPASIREARAHFELAAQHHEAGDYALALQEFQRSHQLMVQAGHPNAPLVLFNVARCYAALDREAEAIRAYERFLTESGPEAPNRDVAQGEVRELQARQAIRGEEADSPTVTLAPHGDETGAISPFGPIVGAVGVASMIAGGITGGLALAAEADATRGCIDGRCPAELAARADEAHMLANVTDALLFGGLAVAAVGVLLIFVLPGDALGNGATARAVCSPIGCQAQATMRF